MKSQWEGLVLEEVDAQLGRLVATLDELFPDDYALIVTADHGQCPLPDDVDGVRLDPSSWATRSIGGSAASWSPPCRAWCRPRSTCTRACSG